MEGDSSHDYYYKEQIMSFSYKTFGTNITNYYLNQMLNKMVIMVFIAVSEDKFIYYDRNANHCC